MYILGDITVTGTATPTHLYIGYSEDGVTTDVEITGTITFTSATEGYAVVAEGVTLPSTMDLSSISHLVYYVDDAVLATVYLGADTETLVGVIDPLNASGAFAGWYTSTGTDSVSGDTISETLNSATSANVYAKVIDNAYLIIVQTVTGVSNVYMNGSIMSYGQIVTDTSAYYAYFAYVPAGSYTITYSVSSGYEMGSTTSYSVTASGAVDMNGSVPDYKVYDVSITGVTEKESSSSSDDGKMGITDYLLIILVVLIAVMAVVIAARLLRS